MNFSEKICIELKNTGCGESLRQELGIHVTKLTNRIYINKATRGH